MTPLSSRGLCGHVGEGLDNGAGRVVYVFFGCLRQEGPPRQGFHVIYLPWVFWRRLLAVGKMVPNGRGEVFILKLERSAYKAVDQQAGQVSSLPSNVLDY